MLPEAFVFYPTAANECVLCLLIKVAQLGLVSRVAISAHTDHNLGLRSRLASSQSPQPSMRVPGGNSHNGQARKFASPPISDTHDEI